jgi:hypothetical protein
MDQILKRGGMPLVIYNTYFISKCKLHSNIETCLNFTSFYRNVFTLSFSFHLKVIGGVPPSVFASLPYTESYVLLGRALLFILQ